MFNNQGELRKITEDHQKALDLVLNTLNKEYGKGTVYSLQDFAFEPVEAISTGSLTLDVATGIGGVPRGRIVEIYGPESAGKSTVALHIIAEAQRRGGSGAFIDVEQALDINYAKQLGVNVDNLIFCQPDNAEQALEVLEHMIRSGTMDVVVLDSVAALVSKKELDGDMGDAHVGLQARLMSQALRKITAITRQTNTTVIFTNQLRQKVGIVYGNPEVTSGGQALKYYASMRLDIRRKEQLKDAEGEVNGNTTKVKIVKNKLAPPFREAEFNLIYGQGIDRLGEIIELGVSQGVLKRSGSWFSYGETRLGQGVPQLKTMFKANQQLLSEIEGKVLSGLSSVRAQSDANTEESIS